MKELVILNSENRRIIALIEDEELVEKYEEDENNKSIEGNIYVGKVQNVLTGLQSAFVNIGEKRNAFIHVKDILPKIDITKNEEVEKEPINKLIKPGDPIIVEVKKEAVDKKGPRLSTHISLTSRFIVFMPNSPFVTVSSKIEDERERERLKNIVEKYLPQNTGAIIRTVSENRSEEDIKEDIIKTIDKWKNIKLKPIEKYPQKIYDKGGVLKKTIVDLVDSNLDKIIVENQKDYELVKNILEEINSNIKIEVDQKISQKYSLEKQLKAIENTKVWLKNGGFITIEKTEALVAIDVNSGKFIGKDDAEETITEVNLEAAKEISKQIRLRDISGIIVIDFIDMKKEENKRAVIEEIIKNSKKDRSKVQVEEFTKLNLMEITRKHINSKKKFN
ncbi:MAG TPA: Rne/Rng family ribonuclease [Candidatus Scatovivens faecipullorum]|nr:Rne/Rng family ribonuclease [Candidatus Scatovivens faecipullorum]